MISVELDREDLPSCRFVISPLWETVSSLHALVCPRRRVPHQPWLSQAESRLAGADFELLRALVPARSYIPDFLTPPLCGSASLEAELTVLCATPGRQVRRELELAYPGRPLPAVLRPVYDHPASGLRHVAEQLHKYFGRTLAQHWPAIRSILDADITCRGRQLAASGPDSVLAGLHPLVSWTGTRLRTSLSTGDHTLSARGHGLLLIPSIFGWPHVQVTIDPGRQPALVYPPLAAASAWGTPPAKPGRALRALLGTTRARVLLALSQPRSTTEIARTLSLSPASASHHLRVLKEAGLVYGRRQGRWVLYGLTTKAEKLIDVSL